MSFLAWVARQSFTYSQCLSPFRSNALRASVWWLISVSETICHIYFTTAYLSDNVSSCRSLREAWLSTALLNSQSLQVTYPFLPLFSACHFNCFLGSSNSLPSLHQRTVFLFLILLAEAGKEQETNSKVSAELLVAQEQPFLQCATPQKALSSHRVVQDP